MILTVILTFSVLLCDRAASISVFEGILRQRIEELELKLFWTTYSKELMTQTMKNMNRQKLDSPCLCLSCRISKRTNEAEGPPMTHHHQYGDCSFKAYFEDKLDRLGLRYGRESDEDSDHFHFLVEGRGDWVFWKWGKILKIAKSVHDSEIKKLKHLFEEISDDVQVGDGRDQDDPHESCDSGLQALNPVDANPVDDLQMNLKRMVLGLNHSSLEEIRNTVLGETESAQLALQRVARAMEDHRCEFVLLEAAKAKLESHVDCVTKDRDELASQVHEVLSERLPALICPISRDVLRDPVLLVGSGHTYERADLVRWLREHDTDPVTNRPLTSKEYVTNFVVKSLLDEQRACYQPVQSKK
jgi:hypothetical protein